MYKIKVISFFWLVYSIVTVFFVFCNHKNLAISEYGIPMLSVILAGMIHLLFNKKIVNKYNCVFLIFIGNILMQAMLYTNIVNKGYLLTYLIYGILGFLVCSIKATVEEISIIGDAYIVCSSLMAINTVIAPVDYLGRISTRFGDGPIFEINYIGFFIFCSVLLLLYRIIRQEYNNKFMKLIYYVALIINTYASLRTSSRNIILGMIIFSIFWMLDIINKKKVSHMKLLKGSIFIIVMSISIYYLLNNVLPTDITERLLNFEITDQSNSVRMKYWEYTIDTIMKHPILGYHISTSVVANSSVFGVAIPAHNTYMSLWINLGIIGLGLIVYLFIQIIKKCIKFKDYCLLGICISIMVMIFIVDFDIIFSFWYILLWMIKKIQYLENEKEVL